ncbi:MAG: regulatory iron-sulfur-containing complex subunit RicT [Polyangia bacterium]
MNEQGNNGSDGRSGGGDKKSGRPRRRRGSRGRGDKSRARRDGEARRNREGGEPGEKGPEKKGAGDEQRKEGSSSSKRRGRGRRRRPRSSRKKPPEQRAGRAERSVEEEPLAETDEIEQEGEGERKDFSSMSDESLEFLKPEEVDEEAFLADLPERDFSRSGKLVDVVGVKLSLRGSGPLEMYDCQDISLDVGDQVIVETGRGLALGEVIVQSTRRLVESDRLSRVIRKATPNDMRQRDRNREKSEAAFRLCRERIERLGLPMKLVEVDYLHGGNKAVFYFCAEGRVDFRQLVRELARHLHIRVEMRQIGVRDASRLLGGIGKCGLRLCCNRYIRNFSPVSIRMAKNQDLVLNPEKVSGVCGRLLCCLSYEDELYREASRGFPRVGRRVSTPEGEGRIKDRDVLKRLVRVQIGGETGLRVFPVDEIELIRQQPDREKGGQQRKPSHGSQGGGKQ